jgi:glycosyltransferase involved in cell wall biosynthesis
VLHATILLKSFRKSSLRGRFTDFYSRCQVSPAVSRSRVVLTVSEHARSEILNEFPHANVRVIPCTIDPEWFQHKPLDDREGYLLMVTSASPHKNAWAAIEAYASYAQRSGSNARPFRIVGLSNEADAYRERLAPLGIAHLVRFMPFVPANKLRDLYWGAAALLLPSFAEGFGIPMLEAMATGTPVIAARAASLPEVGGDAAFYFDPANHEDIAGALETVLSDSRLRGEMAREGIMQAEVYRPDRVGRQVMAFWKEFAGL